MQNQLQHSYATGAVPPYGKFPAHELRTFADTASNYVYKGPDGFSAVTSQKTIPIAWTPQLGPQVTASQPDPIRLQAELVGPFKTINDFIAWVRQDKASHADHSAQVVAVAPVQKVNTWTKRVLTSYVPVSPQLSPAIYDLLYTVTVQTPNGNTVTRLDTPLQIHCQPDGLCS